ncbi:MAG TPA: hypothetical protein VGL77_09870 [Armatimonadota bacterium]|jgi:hypothetical protein
MTHHLKNAAFLCAAMGMGYLGGLLSQTTHPASAAPATPGRTVNACR